MLCQLANGNDARCVSSVSKGVSNLSKSLSQVNAVGVCYAIGMCCLPQHQSSSCRAWVLSAVHVSIMYHVTWYLNVVMVCHVS